MPIYKDKNGVLAFIYVIFCMQYAKANREISTAYVPGIALDLLKAVSGTKAVCDARKKSDLSFLQAVRARCLSN
jgi:hypothetical protein